MTWAWNKINVNYNTDCPSYEHSTAYEKVKKNWQEDQYITKKSLVLHIIYDQKIAMLIVSENIDIVSHWHPVNCYNLNLLVC